MTETGFELTRQLPGGFALTAGITLKRTTESDGSGTKNDYGWHGGLTYTNQPYYSITPRENLIPPDISTSEKTGNS